VRRSLAETQFIATSIGLDIHTAFHGQFICRVRIVRISANSQHRYAEAPKGELGYGSTDMGDLANFLLPNVPTCIVACSAARARFWRSDSRFGRWRRINEMHDPAANQREAEFSSDRPGRSFDSVGKGRHAMSRPESGQNHEKLVFARQIASFLNQSIANSEIIHLALIAPPKFLGVVKTELSDTALRAVVLEESKNLTDLSDTEIKRYFE